MRSKQDLQAAIRKGRGRYATLTVQASAAQDIEELLGILTNKSDLRAALVQGEEWLETLDHEEER